MRNVHIHTYRSIPLYSTVIVVIIYTLHIKKIHYLSVTNVLNVSLFGHLFFFIIIITLAQKRYFIHIFPQEHILVICLLMMILLLCRKFKFLGSEIYSLFTLWLLSLFSCVERFHHFKIINKPHLFLLLL